MGFVFVAVLICAIAFVGWRLVGLQQSSEQPVPDRRRKQAPKGPDDDPDFLRSL
ncbi:hypothetical protein L5G32_07225 [Gordonia sp. HY002]|uniref:hypothetical protein n=1 Tax=Gordonia zhenghanii TaxID=2911516 RepID=UPI001EF14D08|nr:hypothetical protein [Gordonia zhenghanii]MCF8570057.1 hypothetical protein [Gordonia zhenghanii]MCF8604762.1 hypothetical protein [Gordonia zhenghanii]MCF8605212.1 hypothetical protein [Gordonia zhenghanii]